MQEKFKSLTSFLIFFLTVSASKAVSEDWFLISLTIVLIIASVYYKIKFERIIWVIIVYWLIINLVSFIHFDESLKSNFITLFGSIMRIFIAYLLLKLSGVKAFFNAEKISFNILLLGFFIFFITEFFPSSENFIKQFDVGVVEDMANEGGWNILIFTKNPWHTFRFSGYAWEPGALALIIIFSLILSILRDGYQVDIRKSVYLTMLVFTFSTAGFLALSFLILFYSIHFGLSRYFIVVIVLVPLLIPVIELVYRQDFMSDKIEQYLYESERNRKFGYENMSIKKVTRYDYIFLGGSLMSKWPVGYGISKKGQVKSRSGFVLRGSNSLISFLVAWGIIGFIFMLMLIYKCINLLAKIFEIKNSLALFLALLVVLFSNPIERSPLFYGLCLFPLIYIKVIRNSQNYRKLVSSSTMSKPSFNSRQ